MNKTAKRTRPLSPSKFKVGDRVTETHKNITFIGDFTDKKKTDLVRHISTDARKGTVKEVFVKTNARGDRRHYANVLWDGFKSTAEHEQSRLSLHVGETLKQEKTPVIKSKKPSEAKGKKQAGVQILNLDASDTKEIFTAKTEEGYVGCLRTDSTICLTVEVYKSALEAANNARKLKKTLDGGSKEKCKETQKKLTKDKNYVVKQSTKKVVLRSRLYTLEETKAMPLLRFQEVWVIIKDSMYVSSCLDKERRNLVSYTSEKDKAQYFTCHEKAKMTMRVLKGAVGPGFDLKRFFIENK